MSPTLLVLLLLSQAERPPLFPEGAGALRPGAFASVGLGVDNAG